MYKTEYSVYQQKTLTAEGPVCAVRQVQKVGGDVSHAVVQTLGVIRHGGFHLYNRTCQHSGQLWNDLDTAVILSV